MRQSSIRVLQCAAALFVAFGATALAQAGSPHQKGYSDSKEGYSDFKGGYCDCYECRHHHLKHPPRAPVASAVAAPQFVVAQSSVVNPLSADASSINPNVLRALANLIDDKDDAAASPPESANSPNQKGSSRNSAAASPQASGQRDLETEVARLEDKLELLEAAIQKLNESTTQVLKSLSTGS